MVGLEGDLETSEAAKEGLRHNGARKKPGKMGTTCHLDYLFVLLFKNILTRNTFVKFAL